MIAGAPRPAPLWVEVSAFVAWGLIVALAAAGWFIPEPCVVDDWSNPHACSSGR